MPRTRAHLPVLASSVVLVALLAACGQEVAGAPAGSTQAAGSASARTPAPAPTATSPAVVTPPEPAALSKAAAGKRYLDITRPYNEALEAFERGFNAGESVSTLKRRARKVADAAGTEASALDETRWPTPVAALASDLAQVDRRARTQWLAIAAADTRDGMLGKLRNLPSGAATGARIRSLLGLPKYDESGY